MNSIKAHFDGQVFVPDGPVELPVGANVEVLPSVDAKDQSNRSGTLAGVLRIAETLPDNPESPADLAAQHDHYLYGTPKRP